MNETFTVTQEEAGQRLDVFVVSKVQGFSRAALQKAITAGQITINQEIVKPKQIVQPGQTVTIALQAKPVESTPQIPQDIPIIFEDKDILVINKPAGIAVHHGVGLSGGTVVDWLKSRYTDIKNVGEDSARPGIIHRLDKDTSGALLIAKTQKAYDHYKKQFQLRQAKKEYVALTFGVPGEAKGRIVRGLGRSKRNPLRRTVDPEGKEAITEWRKERIYQDRFALLRVYPLTGRTHQIRVHLHWLGFPIVGDHLYNFKRQKAPQGVRRQLLHAEKLTVVTPGDQKRTFEAPIAEDFQAVLDSLGQPRVLHE